jgi:small basic protein
MSSDQQQSGMSGADAGNWLRFLIESWAISVEVFLRTGFGVRYVGSKGAMVLLIVPMFLILFSQKHDPRPLCWFLAAYLVMCVLARVGSLRRQTLGDRTHSFYSGRPRLMGIFRFLSEVTVKQFVEPLFVAVAAVFVGNYNAPLGMYLLGAAACIGLSVFNSELSMRRRVMEMTDAVSEQHVIAERFREIQGDNF